MIVEQRHDAWGGVAGATPESVVDELERGDVVFLPRLGFDVQDHERRIFSAELGITAKNVSYTPGTGRIGGTAARGADAELLASVLTRFSRGAVALTEALLPAYAGRLQVARASFRPAEIEGRRTSWRKDDTRLHVDSFPSSPTGGRRILRIFTNVNPAGKPRTWRIGGPFDELVARFRDRLRMPFPGAGLLLRAIRLTRTRRTPYDALMLQLHDLMKRDADYQGLATHASIDFAAGTTWLAFTDAVSHAAMRGRFQFEQTLLVPVEAMRDPARAPLRILERTMNRALA